MLLATLALFVFQDAPATPENPESVAPAAQDSAADAAVASDAAARRDLDLNAFGGIEAPTQPRNTSSSTVTRTSRIEPVQPMRNVNRLMARLVTNISCVAASISAGSRPSANAAV